MLYVEVKIEGITPLLQHQLNDATLAGIDDGARKVLVPSDATPREKAEPVSYRNAEGVYYIPSVYLSAMLREAGTNHKMRGSRKSVKYIVPAAVLFETYEIPLLDGQDEPIRDFEVDTRAVRIRTTGGRIPRHRPRFDRWRARFDLRIDDTMLTEDLVNEMLSEGGARIGIGDFRPSCGGPFGRFKVLRWKKRPLPACDDVGDEAAAEE